MADFTLQVTENGMLHVAASKRPPPPPVYPNSVYLQCTSDGASVSALSLVVPSLSRDKASTLAAALREAATKLESREAIAQAGSPKDSGVTINLSSVMSK